MTDAVEPKAARQLAFDLPHVPALDAEDFLVSACNAEAMALVSSWPDWAANACLIVGPAGAGKSHLLNVWRKRSDAAVFPASAISGKLIASLPSGPIAVEDLDRGPLDEHALFHLLNLSRERRFDLLMSARTLPGTWRIALPDLRSRLRSLAVAAIKAPDDELLGAVLIKLFADRQLIAPPAVIEYLLSRMERSITAAADLVARMDRAALAEKRKITTRFASRFLPATEE